MAKGTWKLADSPDDPIYSGGFVISSHNLPQGYAQLKKSSPIGTDGQTQEAHVRPEEQYPDLQNLPFDPAEEFLKKLKG